MPRPKLNKIRFMVAIPPELLKKLDAQAARRHKSRTDIVEESVAAYLSDEPPKRSKPKKGTP